MNVLRSLILILLLSSLAGCSSFNPDPIEVTIAQVERAPLILPAVDKISPETVYWFIISDQTDTEVWKRVMEAGYDPVLFGLTDDGYKNIAINQKKILNVIIQQQAVIDALKAYYMPEDTKDGPDSTE